MAKKRANGEGSLRKRSDGRWEGRFTAGHDKETGKPVYKNVLAKTQAECREKLSKAIEEYAELDISRAGEYTLGEYLRYWLENFGSAYLRPSSIRNYTGFLDNQIAGSIGSIMLRDVSTRTLQMFYNEMRKSGRVVRKESEKQDPGLSVKTVRNIHFFMSHALDFAVKEKLIPSNPADDCVLSKKERKEMKTLPLEDLDKFFEEAKHWGHYELYYTELSTGLRRGELVGMKWTDIDFQNNVICIQRRVYRMNGEIVEAPLKTANAYRDIVVSPEVMRLLKEKMERENGLSRYVFSNPTGVVMAPDCITRTLHRALKRAGMEEVRFHDLRHTFATMALQNGVDVKTLSNILGHYSAAFTLDTYTHVTPAMKQDAADKVGGFLESVGER